MTDRSLTGELRALEEQLLQPDFRRNRSAVAALLADDFVEYGSSGRIFTKQQILDLLAAETPVLFELSGFSAQILAPGIALVTYRAVRHSDPPIASLRSSLWIHRDSQLAGTASPWQLRFHQGTRTS